MVTGGLIEQTQDFPLLNTESGTRNQEKDHRKSCVYAWNMVSSSDFAPLSKGALIHRIKGSIPRVTGQIRGIKVSVLHDAEATPLPFGLFSAQINRPSPCVLILPQLLESDTALVHRTDTCLCQWALLFLYSFILKKLKRLKTKTN